MRRAFVMGSNGPAEVGPLRFACEDAAKFKAALSGPRGGFEVIAPESGADPWLVRQQLTTVAETCNDDDVFICYFSGHGYLEKGALFLLWDNTQPDRLLTTALPVTAILEALKFCRAGSKLLILDCCHAGAVVSMLGIKDGTGVPIDEIQMSPDNFLVLMASGRLERARELDALHGSFLTGGICAALSERFYEADKDADGRISMQDITQWLDERVREHNRRFPDTPVPLPYLFGQQKGELFLTTGQPDWIPYEFSWIDDSIMVVLPVRLPDPVLALCMSKHPVTNAQYMKFAEECGESEPVGKHFVKGQYQTPFYPWREEGFREPDKPVVCVSFDDALSYCKWVDTRYEIQNRRLVPYDANSIQLPTTNQWDFAAFGTTSPPLDPAGWLNQTRQLHHKSSTPASIDLTGDRTNSRGISDMFGNIWEWCKEEYEGGTIAGRSICMRAELRGGSFLDNLSKTQPFYDAHRPELLGRHGCYSDLGFRTVLKVPVQMLPDSVRLQISLCKRLRLEGGADNTVYLNSRVSPAG